MPGIDRIPIWIGWIRIGMPWMPILIRIHPAK
jgi:hypothetical protein